MHKSLNFDFEILMIQHPYKAAVVQMNSQDDVQYNLEQAYHLISKAATEENALLVGLPENFAFLGNLPARKKEAGEIAGKVPEFLENTAREFEIYLMGGSYPVPVGEEKMYNHCGLYSPSGELLSSYNKIHLFDVELSSEETYRESDYIEPGEPEPALWSDEKIGTIGLSICYDLRFPEYYRRLSDDGAELLSIPSAFTYTTGQKHWEILLKARAIENTSYVFAPAQTGIHGEKRKTFGHAMIVDPDGRILADAGEEPGIATAVIDPDELDKARKAIPTLLHRRL